MLNRFWPLLILVAVVWGAVSGRLGDVTAALLASGGDAFSLCVTIGGTLCLWNGVMSVATASGVTKGIAFLLRPLLRWLFPRLPPQGAAAQAIAANMTANLLGLGNAATPLGLQAMDALKSTCPAPDTASDEMVTFAVMNTASLQIFPTTVIALRQAAGAADPFSILPAVWAASAGSFLIAVTAAAVFRRRPKGAAG